MACGNNGPMIDDSTSRPTDCFVRQTPAGLYCDPGGFYVDPMRPVDRAVVTHAHSDHARVGSRHYLAAEPSRHVLSGRMAADADLQWLPYGQTITAGGVTVSFHPSGHMLGSAQVRMEYRGQVVVVTGDYKIDDDPTCQPWAPVQCHVLVTESTFGLPVYRWPDSTDEFASINAWWRQCRDAGKCAVLYGYAVGKSQRLIAGLDNSIGPIYTHGAVEKGNEAYRASGVSLPDTQAVASLSQNPDYRGAMVVAVPSAHGTPWLRRFGRISTAMASGWMAVRGARRRRSVDRGFVISDHVDWPSLLLAVDQCRPESVWVTHGYSAVVARYLNETGVHAIPLEGGRSVGSDDDVESADDHDGDDQEAPS
ncbi:hypothetical protein V7x_26600 [Crateriforma conspicua]|uniref:Uncharacterized protein n=2 Tax=Crateriforma conspicua TaxID=2527996 RepID=A0A5C6G0F1_9PLAN|nr:hypothetical protein V7x_26600 [Crateriforma conspicua]